MKPKYNSNDLPPLSQRGSVMIIFAAALVVLVGMAALAVDVGRLMASRNEIQNAADAAALAACRELGEQHYQEMTVDENVIRDVAREVAGENVVAGQKFSDFFQNLENNEQVLEEFLDVQIGYWDPIENVFSVEPPISGILGKKNSVRVSMARNNSISTFFARVAGTDFMSARAQATAALTGVSKVDEGELIPVGISKYWFHHAWPGEFCDQNIKFYPTNTIEGCAGWNTFDISPSSSSTLRKTILEGMTDGTYSSPEFTIGDELEFIGGNIASAFCHSQHGNFQELWEQNKDESGVWKTSVVVYDYTDCSNPNTSLPIVGFSTVEIYYVDCDHEIVARVICDEYTDSRGGGGAYGTYGRIPGLVQ